MAKSKTLGELSLPSGYTEIETSRAAWDFKKHPLLLGKIAAFRTVFSEKKKAPQRVCEVVNPDGEVFMVYERFGLLALFDQKIGASVCLIYRGQEDIGKENPLETFTVGVK